MKDKDHQNSTIGAYNTPPASNGAPPRRNVTQPNRPPAQGEEHFRSWQDMQRMAQQQPIAPPQADRQLPPQPYPSGDFPEGPEDKNSVGAPMIIAIILAALAVLGAAGFFGYVFFFSDKEDSGGTQVSAVASQAETEATTVTAPTSAESKAATMLTMPDISGMSESDAYQTLNEAGVKYKVTRANSEDVAINYVITQEPAAGESISSSEQATIYISKGPQNAVYTTPTSPATTEAPSSKPPQRSQTSSGDKDDDYLLPDSDSEYVTADDLEGFDRETLNLALNEIYARHDRKFSDPAINAYFKSKSWYHGTISPSQFDSGVLNQYEAYNVGFISEYQAAKGYR